MNKKEIGFIEKKYNEIMSNSLNPTHLGLLNIFELKKYIKELVNLDLDVHILVIGQNGLSKSYTAMMLSKILDNNFFKKNNIIYAYHEVSDFIDLIRNKQEEVIIIDELSVFFGSKLQMTHEQISLFRAFEVARKQKNIYISCNRDIHDINKSYREGKAQIVFFILDRYKEGGNYCAVLIRSPIFQKKDPFDFYSISKASDLEQFRLYCELSPAMAGYVFFPHYKEILTEDEVQKYEKEKDKGLQDKLKDFSKQSKKTKNKRGAKNEK